MFRSRVDAGQQLAKRLQHLKGEDTVVLGLGLPPGLLLEQLRRSPGLRERRVWW